VFVRLKRAPEALLERVERIEGVVRAESRVVEPVMLHLPERHSSGSACSACSDRRPA